MIVLSSAAVGVAACSAAVSSASSRLTRLADAVRARTSMMRTVSAQGLVENVTEAVSGLPVWALASCIGGAVVLLVALICCCMQGARSRGRKKAQLEDINPVFQTETWRKLE